MRPWNYRRKAYIDQWKYTFRFSFEFVWCKEKIMVLKHVFFIHTVRRDLYMYEGILWAVSALVVKIFSTAREKRNQRSPGGPIANHADKSSGGQPWGGLFSREVAFKFFNSAIIFIARFSKSTVLKRYSLHDYKCSNIIEKSFIHSTLKNSR